MILIAILVVISLIVFICIYADKQDVSFNAKDAKSMADSPKTLEKRKKAYEKEMKELEQADERNYKMLKKLIARKAKSGSSSLYYDESYMFNDVISYRVKDRLKAEGFTIIIDKWTTKVRRYGFWIKW